MKISTLTGMVLSALCLFTFSRLSLADAPKTDGEIVGLVSAIDKSEINAAHQAEGKNISPEVMAFAKMMDDQHSENLNKLQDIAVKNGIQAPPTTGGMILAEEDKSMAMRSMLNGHDFEKAYIDDMVKGHTDALNLIDTQLLPSVQNRDLRDFLANTRPHVAMHLAKAHELQNKE